MWTRPSLECLLGLALAVGSALAQGLDTGAERERIARERMSVDARAAADRNVCRAEFAQTACVERVEAERRERLRTLDRQRALLDEAGRKERAVAREARIAERRQPDAARGSMARSPRASAEAAMPGLKAEPAASAAEPQRAATRVRAASDAQAQAARRAQAAQRRMAEIEIHRAAVERRNRAATRRPGAPLPASAAR